MYKTIHHPRRLCRPFILRACANCLGVLSLLVSLRSQAFMFPQVVRLLVSDLA